MTACTLATTADGDAAEKAAVKALDVAMTAYEAGVARAEKRLATMLGQVEERARAVRAAVDADPSGAPAAEVDTPAVVAVADEAVPSHGLRNGHEKGPQALPTAGQHPCWWPRGCRRRNVLETLRRGARVRWRASADVAARNGRVAAHERVAMCASAAPYRRMARGRGAAAAARRLYLRAGSAEPNPAMIRG